MGAVRGRNRGENIFKRMHKTEVKSGISYKGSIKLQYGEKRAHLSFYIHKEVDI